MSLAPIVSAAASMGTELLAQVTAETTSSGGLGIFLSDAYSALSDLNSVNSGESASATGSSSSPSSNTAATTTGGSSTAASTATTSTPSSSSTAAAAAAAASSSTHHHSNTLAIALGVSLGALALGLLLLGLWCCCRRRRRARSPRRALSPEDEEVNSWRASNPGSGSSYTHISGPTTPTQTQPHHYPTPAPEMAQHPAMRQRQDSRHENPFVPAVPPPRRSAPNAKPGLTDETVPGQDPFVKPVPAPSTSILRKSISRYSPPRGNTYNEVPTSPTHGGFDQQPTVGGSTAPFVIKTPTSPTNYTSPIASPKNQYSTPVAYQPWNPDNNARHHVSGSYSSGGDTIAEPLPTHYNNDRQATPYELMGGATAAGAGAAGGAAYTHHQQHNSQEQSHFDSSSNSDRQSYESAPYDHPVINRHSTPPHAPSRSPKRARFSDSVTGGSNSDNGRSDSGESIRRLSSQTPGGWTSPRKTSPTQSSDSGNAARPIWQQHPQTTTVERRATTGRRPVV